MMITEKELDLVRKVLETARDYGAQKARATLSVSAEDLVATLNGEVDKVTRCYDSSLSISLFVDGRYGSFSTNKLDEASLKDFIRKAVGTVGMLAPDECRDLPDPARCCRDAVTGNELDLMDPFYKDITPEIRIKTALAASAWGTDKRIVSEEGEYSDSIYDTVVMDTNGLCCRHCENSFDYGVEITIEDGGEKYSGYWWDSSSRFAEMKAAECGTKALEKAIGQIGSGPVPSGKYNLVLDSECASKVVSPILRALNGFSIQQNNSFLRESLGKKVFPDGLTIIDTPRVKGQTCSKFFDSEGVCTSDCDIVREGEVKRYFLNTYMANKLEMEPTSEEATRAKVLPWPEAGLDRRAIMEMCGDGILVTDFNGGNSDPATGDFSYGIEGYLFKDGRIVRPVSEMLVTGNILTLWSSLVAAGDDSRKCMSKLIPTLAFAKVDFSG